MTFSLTAKCIISDFQKVLLVVGVVGVDLVVVKKCLLFFFFSNQAVVFRTWFAEIDFSINSIRYSLDAIEMKHFIAGALTDN